MFLLVLLNEKAVIRDPHLKKTKKKTQLLNGYKHEFFCVKKKINVPFVRKKNGEHSAVKFVFNINNLRFFCLTSDADFT